MWDNPLIVRQVDRLLAEGGNDTSATLPQQTITREEVAQKYLEFAIPFFFKHNQVLKNNVNTISDVLIPLFNGTRNAKKFRTALHEEVTNARKQLLAMKSEDELAEAFQNALGVVERNILDEAI